MERPPGKGRPRVPNYFAWSEPYAEPVALAALARANGLADLLTTGFGGNAEAAASIYPICTNHFCDWCTRDAGREARRKSEPTGPVTTTRDLFAPALL